MKIIIDEEGTEAAGVSMAGMRDYAGGDDTFMIFNRPFFYLIQDIISDTVLFIGAITEF